jgi:hypothetical protein
MWDRAILSVTFGGMLFFAVFALVLALGIKGPNPNPNLQPPAATELREVARGEVEYWGIDRFGAGVCGNDDPGWSQACLCKTIHVACSAYWQVQHVTLQTADLRTRIDALEYIDDTLTINPVYFDGSPPLKCPNNPTSDSLPPLERVNPRFNCHGHALLKSQYWLNDPLPLLNDPRLYARLADEAERAPRDVVTYWNARGEIEHSVILEVRSPKDAREDKVLTKPGKCPEVQELPRGPGLGTAWEDPNATVVYYRPRNP